jgi:hypothetical protein
MLSVWLFSFNEELAMRNLIIDGAAGGEINAWLLPGRCGKWFYS